MRKAIGTLLCAVLVASSLRAQSAQPVPIEPLNPVEFAGFTNVLVLQNRVVEAVIFPDLGRIGIFRFRGEPNAFRFDEALAEHVSLNPREPGSDWHNYGGDWLWPVAQGHWPALFGASWPPPWLIDGTPWKAHGWTSHDDSQTVLMQAEFGAPLHVRITRSITLPPDAAALTIRQRIERTGASEAPVTLWNISQIGGAERVALALDTNSAFEAGYRVLDFDPPTPEILSQPDPEILIVDTRRAREIKIGSDSPRGWIAAQRGDLLIFERAAGRRDATNFPDGGCRTEVYANRGLGYAEIETLSEEAQLAPGEAIENTLVISLYRVPADLTDTELAARLHQIAGESVPFERADTATDAAARTEP